MTTDIKKKAITLRIGEDKWKTVKKLLIDNDTTFQIILEDAIDKYIEENKK